MNRDVEEFLEESEANYEEIDCVDFEAELAERLPTFRDPWISGSARERLLRAGGTMSV